MEISSELLFFFSILGAFNGLFLSVYFLFFSKPKKIYNLFLGAMLLALSIRIGKSVFFYFNPDLAIGYLMFGLTACFFIGPFLFLYVKSSLAPNKPTYWKWHLLLAIPAVIALMYFYSLGEENENRALRLIYLQWLVYVLLSWYAARDLIKKIVKPSVKVTIKERWVLSVIVGVTFIWAGYYFSRYTSYISGALTFSFFLYLMVLFLFFNKKKTAELFNEKSKYGNKKIEANEALVQLEKLNTLMQEKELYKNSNLKLSDLAETLKLSAHHLSQLLNDNEGKNFARYINEFRIAEAQRMISSDSKLTLEAIGYECGFNSKSTFFTTFKNITGKTPSEYKSLI